MTNNSYLQNAHCSRLNIRLVEGYISGNRKDGYAIDKQYKEVWRRREKSANDIGSAIISAVTTLDNYMAVGDCDGRISVLECTEKDDGSDDEYSDKKGIRYSYRGMQQSYVPQIDPLSSAQFAPTVMSLAFIPSVGPRPLLLTTNERVPKLYKLVDLAEPCAESSIGDFFTNKKLPTLCSSTGKKDENLGSVALQLAYRYTCEHEYSITSISPIGISADQFATADYFGIRLWCTEHPETSIETFSFLSSSSQAGIEPSEVIQALHTFPQCPSLLFSATSGGKVHIFDTRQSLQWGKNSVTLDVFGAQTNTSSSGDATQYSENILTDCSLSPSGFQVATRDFLTVTLMDLRRCEQRRSSITNQWDLHPQLNHRQELLQQCDANSERFQLQFLSDDYVVTGGLNNKLYTVDTRNMTSNCENGDEACRTGYSNPVQTFDLDHIPALSGTETAFDGEVEELSRSTTFGNQDSSSVFDNDEELRRPWVTVISRPLRSNVHNNLISFCVSSGASLIQLVNTV